MTHTGQPLGLLGISPRNPVGVKVNCGIRSREKGGAPTAKDRFWLMTPESATEQFGGRKEMARQLHPAFARWNEAALAGSADKRAKARLGTLRGNLVHHSWKDAAPWYRAAQKLPPPHSNPPSRRPACQGNGISAVRFAGTTNEGERFDSIACPNRMCQFAMNGACKPFGALLFQLRWLSDDPFEQDLPPLLALWSTRGWRSVENMVGLLEYVLGTEAILTDTDREHATAEQRALWRPGIAAGLGIPNPSVFGLPFTMTISERTKPSEGQRFTVVGFSPDGDLLRWLSLQLQQREQLAAGAERLALPASIRSTQVRPYLEESLREFDPASSEPVTPEPGQPGLDPLDGPAEVSGSGEVLPSPEEGPSVQRGGEVPSSPEQPTADALSATTGTVSVAPVTDAAPGVAQEPPGPRLLSAARVAELKKFCAQGGKSWDELQNHFGPLTELAADRDGAVVGWIKAKGKRP